MRLNESTARLGLGAALIVAALFLRPGDAFAQTDMSGMPGMTPTATPSPSPAAESTTSPTPTPTPAASAPAQPGMESMPGMAPSGSPAKDSSGAPAKKDMSGMQGMEGMPGMKSGAGSQKKEMDAMPGMGGSEKKGMGAMPGMSSDASAPQRMSAPGVFVLRPPQKWRPPPGDDRSDELLSREELNQHMEPLPSPLGKPKLYSFSLFDLLEYRYNSSGPDQFVWDFIGWYGGDYNRLWVKTAGRQTLSQGFRGDGDLQLLYGRLISPFWDFQIGARARQNFGAGFRNNTRTYAVIGFQGISPGNFDVEPALYISDRGEISAELTLSADVYLTQRLIVQPRFQGELAIQGDPRFSTGRGGTEIDLGVRLRYAVSREVQPYVGVSWLRSFGANARLSREDGETYDRIGLVAGLQLWW
jgi:copper resistance protein B